MAIHCIYHRSDFDGIGSAAVVNYFHTDSDVIMHPYNYHDPLPDFQNWDPADTVYLVDLCFDKGSDMQALYQRFGDNLIWIDHHASGLSIEKDFNLSEIKGIRREGLAAIQLSWEFLFPEISEPVCVKLLGDMDIWNLSEEAEVFAYGIEAQDNLFSPKDPMWGDLFKSTPFTLDQVKHDGSLMHRYVMRDYKAYSEFIHLVNFNGVIVPAVNRGCIGSLIFERNIPNLYKDYLFVLVYYRRKDGWKFSAYTSRNDVDVREYSKPQGGKGHPKACGFVCNELPFTFMD